MEEIKWMFGFVCDRGREDGFNGFSAVNLMGRKNTFVLGLE